MIDPKKIEQIARQVHESMPKGLRDLGEDVEKKIRQVLQSQLTRLDLVSREEFDVQTQVLLRTREKLALLERFIHITNNGLKIDGLTLCVHSGEALGQKIKILH